MVKPSQQAADALVVQIKRSGRAFALFDVAKIVLAGRERYVVEFAVEAGAEASLFRCRVDGSVWLSKDQAMRHFLEAGNLESIYLVENKEIEAPKGEFRAVAVCGMSGEILGPPNHHSYQNAVMRLYKRRFANMPIERFKSRIKTETNEELIAKWKEQESRATHYLYPKEPAEGQEQIRLESMEALERHALTQLADEIVQKTHKATVPGNIPGNLLAPGLLTLLRYSVEPLRTAPFPMVKILCSQLESKGLRIFKRHGKKLFVSKSRPRAIDPGVTLSETIRRITDLVTSKPGIHVKDLVATIAPRAEGITVAEGEYTPEESAVLSDLHWVIDEGYIIEYASSALFLGIQPSDNPPRDPSAKPKSKKKPARQGAANPENPISVTEEPEALAEETVADDAVSEESVTDEADEAPESFLEEESPEELDLPEADESAEEPVALDESLEADLKEADEAPELDPDPVPPTA